MGRIIIQRVLKASVSVDGETISSINHGMLVLVGISKNDTKHDMEFLAKKMLNLQLWSEEQGGERWQKSVVEMKYEILLVSQFTLYAQTNKGKKPNFNRAMGPKEAKELFDYFVGFVKESYEKEKVFEGKFGKLKEKVYFESSSSERAFNGSVTG